MLAELALLPVLECFQPAAQAFALELQAFSVLPFQQTTDLVEKLPAQNVAFEELIIPDEIHDLLRWNDWIRAHCTAAEFFDRRLAASDERHKRVVRVCRKTLQDVNRDSGQNSRAKNFVKKLYVM